jgi:hypothetical protein
VNATEAIATLPRDAARMLAVEILLAEPESLGDDVLESCLYLYRERLRAALDRSLAVDGIPKRRGKSRPSPQAHSQPP